ncbi:MAG TPA: hypothetical protein PKZ76_02130 [Xanthomonadaceae bacterium]|nr:hypothetical protein [Xanthomonadaceae bacterium]
MSDDEFFIFLISFVIGVASAIALSISRLHWMFTRGNPGIGLHRLVVLLTLVWSAYVMEFHGDESIRGFYVFFYLVLTYAAVKLFGQLLGPAIMQLGVRRDVFVRGNRPVALFTAAFALATGIIFGGSLWGEADPLSDDEGGWWIPAGFFLMGWIILITASALYALRGGRFLMQIRREHDMTAAATGAVFVLSCGAIILQGVAGDFWGWTEGFLSMGTIALMLVGHELLAGRAERDAESGRPVSHTREFLEQALFVGLAIVCWLLNRMISAHYVQPAVGG